MSRDFLTTLLPDSTDGEGFKVDDSACGTSDLHEQ